ncbi:MAG: CBS domain-containing protein [SAR324 cluster bacterium]|nr:CBS domain-containing protein [SAR324 cluster bacterium]
MAIDIETILDNQTLKEVDLEPFVAVEKSTPIIDTIEKMKTNNPPKVSPAVIVDGGKPVGMLTQRNAMHRLALTGVNLNSPIETAMSTNPRSLTLGATLREAIELMNSEFQRTVPIVDGEGKIAAVATARVLISHISAHFPTEVYNHPPDPNQAITTAEGA